jgi:hypothetical protein
LAITVFINILVPMWGPLMRACLVQAGHEGTNGRLIYSFLCEGALCLTNSSDASVGDFCRQYLLR